MESEEKKYWENWLDEDYGNYLSEVREAVKRLYCENELKWGPLPFYTPHGAEHNIAVEDLLHRLLPEKYYQDLNMRERFYLLASAWLHDLGMLKMVAKEVWPREYLEDAEIRKRHHRTTEKFIIEYYARCGLREVDKEFLSKLCLYHRKQEDIASCPEEFTVGHITCHLRMLSAYLRLADSLHIDASRTPSDAYAICLAYDISSEAKLHWIKSKLVNGIDINPIDRSIKIEFKIPSDSQLKQNVDPTWARQKIGYIIKLVIDDLRDELNSIINVLIRKGPTHYLDILSSETEVLLNDQMLNDLVSLILNYDILSAPSASKLLEIILTTIANIAGFQIKKNAPPFRFPAGGANDQEAAVERKQRVDDFLKSLKEEILRRRSCHLGLKILIDRCKEASLHLPHDMDTFVSHIDGLYQGHHSARHKIRKEAFSFFNTLYPDKILRDYFSARSFNILLFGYSELVIKAICGFRDYLISMVTSSDYDYSFHINFPHIERDISKKIRIFICEGQPKTQTAARDRLLYHDGAQYALALAKRNFRNIILIPDIVTGNILDKNFINFAMVGANGFTETFFKHSAGHSSVINLIREYRGRGQGSECPKIVLVVSTDKWASDGGCATLEQPDPGDDQYLIEGYHFWRGLENISDRDHIWLSRDRTIYEKFHENGIMLYNPREDVIPIEHLDYIISDKGHYQISTGNRDRTRAKIAAFINDIRVGQQQ